MLKFVTGFSAAVANVVDRLALYVAVPAIPCAVACSSLAAKNAARDPCVGPSEALRRLIVIGLCKSLHPCFRLRVGRILGMVPAARILNGQPNKAAPSRRSA